MAVQKIKSLKGQIDCPTCFSLLQWDSIKDIKVSGGNKYIICPQCGQSLYLDPNKDYWIEEDDVLEFDSPEKAEEFEAGKIIKMYDEKVIFSNLQNSQGQPIEVSLAEVKNDLYQAFATKTIRVIGEEQSFAGGTSKQITETSMKEMVFIPTTAEIQDEGIYTTTKPILGVAGGGTVILVKEGAQIQFTQNKHEGPNA